MRTRDRRVDRHRPVDLPGGISLRKKVRHHAIPGAIAGIAAMPLPHRLPRAELLSGQIPPRDPSAKPVCDALYDSPVVTERVTAAPRVRRQQRLDPLPLLVREHPIPRTRRPHPTTLPRASPKIWETRPSGPREPTGWPRCRVPPRPAYTLQRRSLPTDAIRLDCSLLCFPTCSQPSAGGSALDKVHLQLREGCGRVSRELRCTY